MRPIADYVESLAAMGFTTIGRMPTRLATDITGSPWTIGCETIDRWMVDFTQSGPHLAELGAKGARVQSGWARCEPVCGQPYDWGWLDEIVDSCRAQGVAPWLQTSYGNRAYEGGGGVGLAEGIPTTATALAAWDRWVTALVTRYQDRVDAWEIWNEPDIHNAMTSDEYTAFFIRTASTVRSIQPDACIIGLALAGHVEFARGFLKQLAASGRTDLLTDLSFHFYPHNPDELFDRVDELRALLAEYAPHVELRQGETGAPAENREFMALGKFEWNERKQAAWDLRRLLAHHVRGIKMSLFQLADMQYSKQHGKFDGRNAKGLLCINPDKTVAYRRPSYFMAQHVFSLLDDRFPLKPLTPRPAPDGIAAYGWACDGADSPSLLAWWDAADAPCLESPELARVSLDLPSLVDPILLDFMSGMTCELPADFSAQQLPCADTPLALVERQLIYPE